MTASWRRAGTLAAICVAAAASPKTLFAQTGSLQGRITDASGTTVLSAVVSVDKTSLRVAPNSRGTYVLNGVPAGRQILRVRALGFNPESISVNVVESAVTPLDVTLHKG